VAVIQEYSDSKTSAWLRFKAKIKPATIWAAKFLMPVAISMVTGGAGAAFIAGPILEIIHNKFAERGVKAPPETLSALGSAVEEGVDPHAKLESILDSVAEQNPEMPREELNSIADSNIRPIFSDLKNILDTLKTEMGQGRLTPEMLPRLLDEWRSEQVSAMQSLQAGIVEEIGLSRDQLLTYYQQQGSMIQTNFSSLASNIAAVSERINRFEQALDLKLASICGNTSKLTNLTPNALLSFCEAYIIQSQVSSEFDVPYNASLYVINPELNTRYNDFLRKASNPLRPPDHRLFLMLSNLGMGKTWNAVHLGLGTIQYYQIPVFFFVLRKDFQGMLEQFFGTSNAETIGQYCDSFYTANQRPIMFLMDGLDEVRFEKEYRPILNFISDILTQRRRSVLFLLTCRSIDWMSYDPIASYSHNHDHVAIANIHPSATESEKSEAGIQSQASAILTKFSDDQIVHACSLYGLIPQKIDYPLRDFCQMPFFIRLLAEYLVDHPTEVNLPMYPSPSDPVRFFPIFLDQTDSARTILGRMGIISGVRKFFFHILQYFEKIDNPKNFDAARSSIDVNRKDWLKILSAGLILEKDEYFNSKFYVNTLYKPLILLLKQKLGHLPSSLSPTFVSPSRSEKTVSASIMDDQANSAQLNFQPSPSAISERISAPAAVAADPRDMEIAAIKELERLIREPINPVSDILQFSTGYTLADGHVVQLGLYGKQLRSLPESIGHLIYLKKLNLGGNAFPNIPLGMMNLRQLESLDLSNNKTMFIATASTLPQSLRAFLNVKDLNLSQNNIINLPEWIGEFQQLEKLDLSYNKLINLPGTLAILNRLKWLDLRENLLKGLDKIAKNALKTLKDRGCVIEQKIGLFR
jgi:hypothetical protein